MKTLLVPSAKLVPPAMAGEFGAIPHCMVPLGNRPALAYILEEFTDEGWQRFIGGHDGIEHIASYRKSSHAQFLLHDVGATASLGETILSMLMNLRPEDLRNPIVINLGDTLVPGSSNQAGDFFSTAVVSNHFRYTTASSDGLALAPANELKEHGLRSVFTGVFGIDDPRTFAESLTKAAATPVQGREIFFEGLRDYFRRSHVSVREWPAPVWHDFGHVESYYETKRRLVQGTRSFNSLTQLTQSRLRKTSSHRAKFRAEVAWYENIPSSLQAYTARVFAADLDGDPAYCDLEFYGYPALADAYLYGAWDLGTWERAFSAVLEALGDFRREAVELSSEEAHTSKREVYVSKTFDRLQSWMACRDGTAWPNSVNGRSVVNEAGLFDRIEEAVAASQILEGRQFSVMHGDLCLSNILFDSRSGAVKLIDPRGSFGSLGVHGDAVYDWAKLAHSLHGDYDHLTNGLFTLQQSGDDWLLMPHLTEAQGSVKRLFDSWLLAECPYDMAQVRVVEALLFLSMIPLHDDRPESQLAYLARGLELLAGVSDRVG